MNASEVGGKNNGLAMDAANEILPQGQVLGQAHESNEVAGNAKQKTAKKVHKSSRDEIIQPVPVPPRLLDGMSSSDVFNRVMDDLNLKAKYNNEGLATVVFSDSDDEEDEGNDGETIESTAGKTGGKTAESKRRTNAAQRAWNILRRHTKEIGMAKKNTSANLNWSFLKHTISRMSDKERARQELYEKYLDCPEDWTEGFSANTKQFLKSIGKQKEPMDEKENPALPHHPAHPHTKARLTRSKDAKVNHKVKGKG